MSFPSPRRLPESTRVRWALLGMVVAAVAGSPFAIAQVSERSSVIAGTKTPVAGSVLTPTTLVTNVASQGLAVTNSSNRGAAGLFTCRSIAAARRFPCLRSINQRTGLAFQFAFRGSLGGLFQVGSDIDKQFPEASPFMTNATGVAVGLNADRVDGLHAQDIIDEAVSKASVQVGPQGPQGAQGAQGSRGPQGAQGPSGPPGTPLVAAESTDANATFGNRTVVGLANEPLNSTEPDSVSDGNDLLPGDSIVLDPGTYIVQTTFRALDFAAVSGSFTLYGVAAVFLDGQRISTLTTPDIPGDGNNVAMASDTTVIGVPTGAGGVIEVRGVVRQNATATGGTPIAQGGVSVIVTEVNAG